MQIIAISRFFRQKTFIFVLNSEKYINQNQILKKEDKI